MTRNITLREASPQDIDLLFAWANDPLVRRNALDSRPISIESHRSWFQSKLDDANSLITIGLIEQKPIGQIRFDIVDTERCEVDVHLSYDARGRGLGSRLISTGVKYFLRMHPDIDVYALVKTENQPSFCAFIKAGFRQVSVTARNDIDLNELLFVKTNSIK